MDGAIIDISGDTMWDTVQEQSVHLSHDRPCQHCGHAMHVYLACGDGCDCEPARLRGLVMA